MATAPTVSRTRRRTCPVEATRGSGKRSMASPKRQPIHPAAASMPAMKIAGAVGRRRRFICQSEEAGPSRSTSVRGRDIPARLRWANEAELSRSNPGPVATRVGIVSAAAEASSLARCCSALTDRSVTKPPESICRVAARLEMAPARSPSFVDRRSGGAVGDSGRCGARLPRSVRRR